MEESRASQRRREQLCVIAVVLALFVVGYVCLSASSDLGSGVKKESKAPQRNGTADLQLLLSMQNFSHETQMKVIAFYSERKLDEINDRIGFALQQDQEYRQFVIKTTQDSLELFGFICTLLALAAFVLLAFNDVKRYLEKVVIKMGNRRPQADVFTV